MDIKVLLQVLGRPWMMEPQAAQHWAGIASRILSGENIPLGPVSGPWGENPYSTFYRVNKKGVLSANGPVLVMNIEGPILKYNYCGAPGTQSLTRALHQAGADETIESIILFMDSPGGSVDGTEDFAKAVKNSKKPVVAYINSMMCSAAYWIGSSASQVISTGANAGYNAVIGSIGTMSSWKDITGKLEKEGVKLHEVYASASFDKNQDFKKANEGDYAALINNVLDPLNKTFLSAVKSNRSGKLKLDQENVLSGKTYNANEALKFGLIDKIGDFQTAVKESLKLTRSGSSASSRAGGFQSQTMDLTRTQAAAQVENFEALNEGIWLTEENLQNIENVLQQNETELQTRADQIAELTDAANADDTTISNLQNQIDKLTSQRDALQAQVEELGGQTAEVKETTRQKDEFPDHKTEAVYAHNQWADEMLGEE